MVTPTNVYTDNAKANKMSNQEGVDKAVEYLNKDKPKEVTLDNNTFKYLKPTDIQMAQMETCRNASDNYARVLETHLLAGPDKTYAIRKLREVAMWANIAITRNPDGSPRT